MRPSPRVRRVHLHTAAEGAPGRQRRRPPLAPARVRRPTRGAGRTLARCRYLYATGKRAQRPAWEQIETATERPAQLGARGARETARHHFSEVGTWCPPSAGRSTTGFHERRTEDIAASARRRRRATRRGSRRATRRRRRRAPRRSASASASGASAALASAAQSSTSSMPPRARSSARQTPGEPSVPRNCGSTTAIPSERSSATSTLNASSDDGMPSRARSTHGAAHAAAAGGSERLRIANLDDARGARPPCLERVRAHARSVRRREPRLQQRAQVDNRRARARPARAVVHRVPQHVGRRERRRLDDCRRRATPAPPPRRRRTHAPGGAAAPPRHRRRPAASALVASTALAPSLSGASSTGEGGDPRVASSSWKPASPGEAARRAASAPPRGRATAPAPSATPAGRLPRRSRWWRAPRPPGRRACTTASKLPSLAAGESAFRRSHAESLARRQAADLGHVPARPVGRPRLAAEARRARGQRAFGDAGPSLSVCLEVISPAPPGPYQRASNRHAAPAREHLQLSAASRAASPSRWQPSSRWSPHVAKRRGNRRRARRAEQRAVFAWSSSGSSFEASSSHPGSACEPASKQPAAAAPAPLARACALTRVSPPSFDQRLEQSAPSMPRPAGATQTSGGARAGATRRPARAEAWRHRRCACAAARPCRAAAGPRQHRAGGTPPLRRGRSRPATWRYHDTWSADGTAATAKPRRRRRRRTPAACHDLPRPTVTCEHGERRPAPRFLSSRGAQRRLLHTQHAPQPPCRSTCSTWPSPAQVRGVAPRVAARARWRQIVRSPQPSSAR